MASMSILDDAIREHLELKRAHGADDAEIKRLEDEAFGPPGRPGEPDPAAEAPTEFMATPEAEAAQAEDTGGHRINIADLQEAPPADAPIAPAEDAAQAAPPAEEEPPALEHEIVAEPEAAETEDAPEAEVEEPVADAGHSTEERHAIAEQPTEFFDVEAEMGTEDAPPVEAPSPSDEEIVEAETAAPPLAPIEPATEIHASRAEAPAEDVEEEEDDDFWSEQRLSDELDQALEAPLTEEDQGDEVEFETLSDEPEAPSEEPEQPKPAANYDPDTGHEDVLEDTPEFLEDAPEDDELWFEQKPPKDFDFDD
jgi:hypothetical protein